MDTDDLEKSKAPATPETSTGTGELLSYESNTNAYQDFTVTVPGKDGDWQVVLTTRYSWAADGRTFTVHHVVYTATNNDLYRGVVLVGLFSEEEWGPVFLTETANQNGHTYTLPVNHTMPAKDGSVGLFLEFRYKFWWGWERVWSTFPMSFTPRTPSIDPLRNVSSRTFTVTGAGGLPGIGAITLHNVGGNQLAPAGMLGDGTWRASISIPLTANSLVFYATQKIGDRFSNSSQETAYLAAITSPASGTLLVTGDKFQGIAAPGTTIKVVRADDRNTLLADVTIAPSGTWEAVMTATPISGEMKVEAQYSLTGFTHGYTAPITYNVLGAPAITLPAANSTQPTNFTLHGNNGLNGATVDVFIDLTQTKVGTGTVEGNGTWTAAVTLPSAGPVTLAVLQKLSNRTSVRGASRAFNGALSEPTLLSRPKGEGVELHGTGYTGALMEVNRIVGPVLLDAVVAAGIWNKEIPPATLPGNYSLKGRQSISDGGSGRIYSDWSPDLSVNLPTPRPTDMNVTVNGQKGTFSGKGRQWEATRVAIEIRHGAGVLPGVPHVDVQANLDWTVTATADHAPGVYSLTARQWVNNQWSADSATFSMTVASLPPVFTKPDVDGAISGQRPQIMGTAWPGSTIVLKIPGKPDVPLTATGGTFTLSADADWAPRTYALEATAKFGDQTSSVGSRTFTVRTPPPSFTTLPGTEVDLVPIIEGKGWPGCWIVVYSPTNLPVGAGRVDASGIYSVTLTRQETGPLTIYAKQQESEGSSNVSEMTTTLTVDVQMKAPFIEVPPAGGTTTRSSVFSGNAVIGGLVDLYMKGAVEPFKEGIQVQADTTWRANVNLPVGPVELEVVVRLSSAISPKREHAFRVVPNTPVIDSPREGEALGRMLFISGTGFPTDTIFIDRHNNNDPLGKTEVKENGTWTFNAIHNMSPDDSITAIANAGEGLNSEHTPYLKNSLLSKTLPQITEPRVGDYVGLNPYLSGVAQPDADITVSQWYDASQVVASTTADEKGEWSVTSDVDFPDGPAWVIVRQTVQSQASEWVQSDYFVVERMPNDFTAPIVDYPVAGAKVGKMPMWQGRGLPWAEVTVYQSHEADLLDALGTTFADRYGNWKVSSTRQLPVATSLFSYCVRQRRDRVFSERALSNFEVISNTGGFEAAIIERPIDDELQVLEQRPLFSGKARGGAEIQIYSSDTAEVYALARADGQGFWSVRTDYELPVDATSYAFKAWQIVDGLYSQASEVRRFKVANKVEIPVVLGQASWEVVTPRAVIHGTALPGARVKIVRFEDTNDILGEGIADAQGRWLIVTLPLPPGNVKVKAGAFWGDVSSGWSPTSFDLDVREIG
ncbi:hypothetical protein ACYZT7_07675 [Pseudomonas sp. RT4P38]